MKRNAVFLLLVMPLLAMAGERSAADAAVLAAQFMNEQYAQAPQRKAMCHVSSFILSHTRAKKSGDGTAFYVFNKADEGFVVVSGDDRTEDVLMYSDEGRLDVENANPNVQFWLNRLQDEISAAEDANTYSPQEKQARKATHVTAIAPLLKNKEGNAINWYQESPYYNQCPSFGIKKCLTGCVATATAMVMYMWRYPVKGTGSRSYKTTTRKLSVSQDFSAVTFD